MSLRSKLHKRTCRTGSTRSTRSAPARPDACSTDEICLIIPNEPSSKLNVGVMIQNKVWETLDFSNIVCLHDTDYLTPVEYTEICVAWIEFHRPDQTSVAIIWNTVPFNALCDRYIWDLKNHLTDHLKYDVHARASKNRHIISYSFPCNPTELKYKKETWQEWQGCGMVDCTHIRNHAVKLQLKQTGEGVPLYIRDKKVKYPACSKISVRHYHPGCVVHWWGWTDTWKYRQLPSHMASVEFDSLDDEYCKRTFVSLLTNTMDEFFEKINKGGWKYIACMVRLR